MKRHLLYSENIPKNPKYTREDAVYTDFNYELYLKESTNKHPAQTSKVNANYSVQYY